MKVNVDPKDLEHAAAVLWNAQCPIAAKAVEDAIVDLKDLAERLLTATARTEAAKLAIKVREDANNDLVTWVLQFLGKPADGNPVHAIQELRERAEKAEASLIHMECGHLSREVHPQGGYCDACHVQEELDRAVARAEKAERELDLALGRDPSLVHLVSENGIWCNENPADVRKTENEEKVTCSNCLTRVEESRQPPWACIIYDETGYHMVDGAQSVHDLLDSSPFGDFLEGEDPPEAGVWYWEGEIGWHPGPYEYPLDGESVLKTKRWTKMTVKQLSDGERPELPEDKEAT